MSDSSDSLINDSGDSFMEDVTSGSEYTPGDSDLSDGGPARPARPPRPAPRRNRNHNGGQPAKKQRTRAPCNYKENCYRKNPEHFKDFSHPHLEKILAEYKGSGNFEIPAELQFNRQLVEEQLSILKPLGIYPMSTKNRPNTNGDSSSSRTADDAGSSSPALPQAGPSSVIKGPNVANVAPSSSTSSVKQPTAKTNIASDAANSAQPSNEQPKRKIEDFFNVVAPKGIMEEKHEQAAPYYMFFTTITSAPETHSQPLSITFQELLDPSLGKLECSLQINFMVDIGWLLAQYYFAGYNNKPLTILYGDDNPDIKNITQKKPNVKAFLVPMKNPFGKHHTKMSLLCYEDGSLRVVVSTANLYIDDWENRTQGLWLSPSCPRLEDSTDASSGESPTGFKQSLISYLNFYSMPCLAPFIERVKQTDFSSINVFFIGSVPGTHQDALWGMTRVGSLLSKHCTIPEDESDKWEFVAQASSIGSYGNDPKLWLCGEFKTNFCKSIKKALAVPKLPHLKLIYPSLTNVRNSHDNLLGGGCLPYSKSIQDKQPWLTKFMYEWSATHSGRQRAMPHIKSYLRMSPDYSKAAYFLLTSGNASKAAWGTVNKGNGALRINSYEAGVLFLPKFILSKDYFSLDVSDCDRIPIPYDLPPIPYEDEDVPWVMEYLV